MMRIRFSAVAAATLAASTATIVATPLMAQETKKTSNTRKVLGRVLQAVLGPDGTQENPATTATAQAQLAQVLADVRRDEDRARDEWRHPAATLDFFRVAPGQTVAEYAPGGGWYTRVIAPYVTANGGRFVGLNFGGYGDVPEQYRDSLAQFPANFPGRVVEMAGVPATSVAAYTTTTAPAETAGTLDRILIIRMMHNMKRWGIVDSELMAMRKMLKDDGLVGIVQHQAPENMAYDMTDGNRGYMKKSDVVALMDAYGFDLVAESAINENPRDTATWEGGVWQLPPSWASKDEGLKAVGESNRMTLLFKKSQ